MLLSANLIMTDSLLYANTLVELSNAYDFIFVDSPCVLPVADAQIMTASCDMTILVLRANKTTRRAAQVAIDNLLSVGGHLLGIVINDVPHSDAYHPKSGYKVETPIQTDSDDWPDDTEGGSKSRFVALLKISGKGRFVAGEMWKGMTRAFRHIPSFKHHNGSQSA